jgi:hypothetical protein
MLIYICLSSHGFGHAARQAAVLSALHCLAPTARLVLSSAVDPAFLRLVLMGLPVEQRRLRWDVGMVQSDALGTDPAATLEALQRLDQELPQQLDAESAWLASQRGPVVVVGDVPPAAAALAQRLGAPLIWMANFGWDEIYAPLGDVFADHAEAAAAAYRQGTLLLRCPFSLAMPWGVRERSVGLTVSPTRPLPADLREALAADPRASVFVGFGGLGLVLNPELFSRWPSHRFLLNAPVEPERRRALEACGNVLLLPCGVRPLDVLKHCERHLGKPGYSSFCEALSAGCGLHVVERSGFAEAPALIEGLRLHAHHRVLRRDQLESGDWQLDQPLLAPAAGALPTDGAQAAALAILRVASAHVGSSDQNI